MVLMIHIMLMIVLYILNHWTQYILKFKINLDTGAPIGKNAKRMRFQIKGLEIKWTFPFLYWKYQSPVLYDTNNDVKSLGQTIPRMSNLSSFNRFDT